VGRDTIEFSYDSTTAAGQEVAAAAIGRWLTTRQLLLAGLPVRGSH
jgi:hypothetical protein